MGLSRKSAHFVLVLGLILAPALAFAVGSAECELQAQKKKASSVAVKFLMDGYGFELFSAAQLAEMAATNPHTWTNPFAPYRTELNGNSLFHGFDRVLPLLRRQSPEETTRELQTALAKVVRDKIEVQNAQEQTKLIFGRPEFVRNLSDPNGGKFENVLNYLFAGTLEGRPIFTTVYERAGGAVEILLDPLHPDAQKRVHVLEEFSSMPTKTHAVALVEMNGEPHALSSTGRDGYDYDIKNKRKSPLPDRKLRDMLRLSRESQFFTHTDKGDKLVTAFAPGELGGEGTTFHLWDFATHTHSKLKKDCSRFKFHKVGARHFATCFRVGRHEILTLDIDAGKFLDPVRLEDANSAKNIVMFEENQNLQAAVLYTEGHLGLYRYDLQAGKKGQKLGEFINVHNLGLEIISGQPHYRLRENERVIVGSLDGLAHITFPTGSIKAYDFIEWRGQKFLYQLGSNYQARVFDMRGTVVLLQRFTGNLTDSTAFEYQGKVYALHLQHKKNPALYLLTAEERK